MNYIIGVDFDNTLVNYDEVIYSAALEQGLIHPDIEKSKKEIREKIRQLSDGEIKWQKLQAFVYGPRMQEPRLSDGVQWFFKLCNHHKTRLYIISHKTRFAKFDETGTDLRTAAVAWMRRKGFFDTDGFGLSQRDVYFESTRHEKIERIRHVGCTHFIDDLEETFLENSFPTNVEKILYAPHMQHSFPQGVRVVASWEEISDYFFDTGS